MKAGYHWDQLCLSLIKERINALGALILTAFEIRMCEGISREIPVTTRNKKTKLNIASLISRKEKEFKLFSEVDQNR